MISLDPGVNLQMNLSKIITTWQSKLLYISLAVCNSLHCWEYKNVAILNSVVKMEPGLVFLKGAQSRLNGLKSLA